MDRMETEMSSERKQTSALSANNRDTKMRAYLSPEANLLV